MNNAHPLSTPIVVRSLDPKKDPFCPKEDDEEILSPKVYLNAISALLYLPQSTRQNIAVSVNLLVRFSPADTATLE